MKIEKLQRKDLASYKALMDTCFDGSNDIAKYEKYDENGAYEIVVAKDGEKIAGSVTFYKMDLFTFSFQPAIEIFNVAVLPEYREQKLAKQLMEYVAEWGREHGYKSMFLTCLDTAVPAHRLYESVGMKRASSVKYSMPL